MSARVLPQSPAQVKRHPVPPLELSQGAITRLVQAFVEGKREVLEDDVLVFLRWCTAQRMGALLVEMILEGDLRPSVDDGEIKVALREQPVVGRRN